MLSVKIEDYNVVSKKSLFMSKLRKLTLHSSSGMNHELNELEKIIKTRSVKCKIVTAYFDRKLVGWALLSREPSNFTFVNTYSNYNPSQGVLFQVFVDPLFRRKGIGSALVEAGKKYIGSNCLCVCPWDNRSDKFYAKYENINHKIL